ncbi:DdpA ABC-type dipeptide transport system, periplasmic component [Rhabdaerophilaceae bacterium]
MREFMSMQVAGWRVSRRLALTAGAMIMATTALVAIAPASAQTPRDTVVMAKQIDDIISLDPAEVFEFSGSEIAGHLYDRLIAFDAKETTRLYGQLAESWTVGDDGMTYTFKLKPSLKFHSGNPITAADVVYSFERVVQLNKSPGFIITQFGIKKENVRDVVKAIDDLTVSIKVDKPYAPSFFLNCLTSDVASIVDTKVVQANAVNNDWGNEWMKRNSAGSGSYILRGWRANEQVTMEANPNWIGGAPKNRRVVIRHVPEPASQRLLLEKGDVDYARNLTKDQLAAVAGNANIVTEKGDKGYILYLGLNLKNPNFAKPEVREALKWLTDYDAIERNIVSGTHLPHQSFLPKGFLGAISDKPYKYDVAKAKELLAKAGLPNGFTVTMDVRNTSPIQDIAQAIQAQWAAGGVKLELLPADGRATLTKYRARTHDIYIGQWGPDYLDPHTNAETFAINESNVDDARSKTLAWRNAWEIPEMTQKTLANVLERDTAKRKAVYEELQREHQKTSPFVMLFQQIEVPAYRKNVSGFVIGPLSGANQFHGITKQ